MATVRFTKTKWMGEVSTFNYDPATDVIFIEYATSNPVKFKEDILKYVDANDTMVVGEDGSELIFSGYTKIARFYATIDSVQQNTFNVHVSFEKDETTYEKLISRIAQLEEANKTLTSDVTSLQKVNLVALVKDNLISNETAMKLIDTDEVTLDQISLDDIKGGLSK